jgi:signal transduction histidine kinase
VKREGLLGLGMAYLGNGNLIKAEDCFLKSLDISKRQNNLIYQINNLQQLGLVESARDNDQIELKYLTEALSLAEGSDFVDPLIQLYNRLAKVYGKEHNYEKTAYFLGKYTKLKDSVYSDDLIKNLAKVQTNYAERENIKTIKEQDQILILKEQLIDRQRTQYFFIILITVLVLGLALVLLIATRRPQRSSTEITTAKVKIEEQNKLLEEQNKVLDDRVKARTVELSKSNILLTEVNGELDNFLYKTSHDIRGPLATMQGLCNIGLIESKDGVVTDILHQMVGQSDRMSKVLGRLTAISNINQASLTAVSINLGAILNGILLAEKENCLSRKIKVTFQIADHLNMISDELLVRTILENLVSNGIKFYNSSVRIESFVHIEVTQDASSIMVRVEDNGIGIPDAKPDQVFHMFMRASERSETGGVGLYLSKVCTDRLGGEIKLERSDKEGTSFLVIFPKDLSPVLERRNLWLEGLQKLQEEEIEKNQKLSTSI